MWFLLHPPKYFISYQICFRWCNGFIPKLPQDANSSIWSRMYNKNIKSVTWHKRITIQRCENANYGMKKLHVLSPHQLFTTTVPIKGSINNMSSSRRWIYEYQCSSLDCYKSHKQQNSSYDPNYGNMSIYRVCIYI